ncbi:uncharacterized protein ppp1r3ab [Triplophysa rosa]|uniref:CBM21 domain-containing protein n=1 Tax=Triplophysa rosa TaxID=992332 RepID=A0A9W8C9H1_TRIRA|nr:uncharacterized protein ppp1r3ab [Triplophysa rosa]KAI7811945.1 putative protein phosphatase 1 regulatory subunit 3A [Triplophysa rosa]
MESVGALGSPTGANSNLLDLPSPCLWDEDDEALGREGIRPKSSPVPRRRSSASSDDSQPPPSSSRRVSFADTFGLNLVSVKQFDAWAVTVLPDPLECHLNEAKEYFMVPLFVLPQTGLELEMLVLEKKIELENLELLPGTTTLRGVIRVLNLCFDKMVYVRISLDLWRSHFDLLAEYVPGSHDGEMDCFSFKLTLVPPFGEEGARVDFCLRYETSLGTFWANNNGNNFAMYCREKTKEKPQNESENRRKSCLRGSSSNVSALTTNNMEFPDINLNSGQATGPEPQNTNAEELQKESKELLEEISRNRSQRNRRKAARLAKVKEHFARREEEKKHWTKTTESEVTAETRVQEHASVPAKGSCSLSQQTPPGLPTCNQISPAPDECLEEDSTRTVTFKQQDLEQHVQDAVIHSETNPSTAQTDSYLDETDDLSDQLVSFNPPVLGHQHDLSTGKDVEKAWEDFEQDAKQRIRCKMDKEENTSKEKPAHRENVSLNTNHSVPQLFSQNYAFGTIIAPLYHQVFKNIQSERTFKELNDGSPRAITPPESDQPPMRQNTEIGLESCVSTKQTQHDGESTEQNPANTKKETKKSLSDPYRNKDVQGAVSSHSCIKEHSTDPTNNQSQTKVETISLQTNVIGNNLPLNISNQFPKESQNPRNTSFMVPQNAFNSFPTQTQQQITSILNPNQVELPKSVISERSTEISNLSAMPLVQTENTYNLPQSSEGPKMFQTSSNSFDSSDDQSGSDCSEMRLNNEIFNLPESECSKAVESYQINESNEQMTVAFSSQPQTFNITDDTNDFYGEYDNTTMIEEIENIQNGKLVKKYEKECHILEDLVEEEKGNQAIQIENQEVNQEQKEEQESAKEEEIGGGIWNIVDELKYIDDEEDINMGTVEMENKQNQQSDFNQQSYAVVQPSNSVNQQSYRVNEESDSVNQQSDSVNEQSNSENQQSDSVNQQSDSENQQSDLVNQKSYAVTQASDSVNQQSDSVNQQSESVNEQSHSENQQSDLENQQSDSVNQQSDSVNEQSHSENQQSDLENQQSDSVNKQSDLVNQQSDSVNQQSDPENQQSDPENQQSDPKNQQSDPDNQQLDSENPQLDSENQQSDLVNQQSDSVNRQSDSVNQPSDSVNQQSDSVNQQSDLENQQSDLENQQSESMNERSDLENQQEDSVNQHSDSENQQSDPENQQSDPENQKSDLENQQADLVNQQANSVNRQSDSVNRQSDLENQQSDPENQQSDPESQQSDPENQQSDSVNQQAYSVHLQTIEQQPKLFIIKSNSESLNHSSIELDIAEEHQSTEQSRSGDEDSSGEEAADKETDTFWNESTKSGGDALSASIHGMRNDWDHLEFIDKELTVCCESEKLQNKCKPNDENMQENMECQSKDSTDAEKDVEDNTSTESLVDDEMELYLTCLRNSQQSVFRDGLANVNYGKRPSVSRGRSMSLTMPSISESVDEDQPNSSLEKASNTEDITELERAIQSLVEGNEHVIGCNVLWWKEFLSYDNMSRVVGYSFLLILFFVVAYYYDFAACFALYLLTVYWLFKQPEQEPVKGSRRGERQL